MRQRVRTPCVIKKIVCKERGQPKSLAKHLVISVVVDAVIAVIGVVCFVVDDAIRTADAVAVMNASAAVVVAVFVFTLGRTFSPAEVSSSLMIIFLGRGEFRGYRVEEAGNDAKQQADNHQKIG